MFKPTLRGGGALAQEQRAWHFAGLFFFLLRSHFYPEPRWLEDLHRPVEELKPKRQEPSVPPD
jgi:hypothetical protein